MKLFMCSLRQRNRSLLPSIAALHNAHTLNGTKSQSASFSSYPSVDADSRRFYSFRAAVPDGSQHLAWSQFHRRGHSPFASGLRAMHWMASTNYHQLGHSRDNVTGVKDSRLLAGRGERPRFSAGFHTGGPALWTLMGANVAVFAMWFKLPPTFMSRHFLVSYESLINGRLHTLITAAFSHADTNHFLWNMVTFFCFGGMIETMYGGLELFLLYLCGGVIGSWGHVIYHTVIYPRMKKIPFQQYNLINTPSALGASGAVTTLTLLFILHNPNHPVLLMFVPMPAAVAGCVLIGKDVYQAIQGGGKTSVGGHLGGALFAICFYLIEIL